MRTPTPSAAPGVLFPPAPDEAAQCDSRDRGQLSRCLAHADPLCRRPIAEEAGGVGARRADRDLVLAFLDELEEKRNNSVTTRNARLAAIRSFFRHVAAADPASFGVAQRVLTIPIKRTHIDVTYHLTTAEVDTLIAAPDPKTPRGRRDEPFCSSWHGPAPGPPKPPASTQTTFSWSGRTHKCCCAAKGVETASSPLLRTRLRALTSLLSQRGIAHHEPRPIFLGARNERRAYQTGFGRQAHIAAHLPALPRHEASPVRRGPFDDPSLARACTGRHDPPLCHSGCRDDAQWTREGGRHRRSRRAFPTK